MPKFGADRSAWGNCLFWGDSLGSIYISLGYFYSNFNSNWRYGGDFGFTIPKSTTLS